MKDVELFKLLADDNRFKIFTILIFKEVCVCDLEKLLNMKQANVSKHLIRFKEANIVNTRKNAQWVYYSINNEFVKANSYLIDYVKDKALKNIELISLINSLNENNNCIITKE